MVKCALLIGINYNRTELQLQGCQNDVKDMRTFLQNYLGYTRFITLTDDTYYKPTKNNILKAFKLFVEALKPGDEGMLMYSGHGTLIADNNGDEESGFDTGLVPIDYNYKSSGLIRDDIIRKNVIDMVPKGVKLYIIIDACNSGTGGDVRYKLDDLSYIHKPNADNTYPLNYVPSDWTRVQTLYEFKNYSPTLGEVWIIAGCQDDQTSEDAYIESEQTFNGALTNIILSILKSSDLKTLKWSDFLEAICCNERINGYSQRTPITSGRPINMDSPVFTFSAPRPVKLSIPPNKGKRGRGVKKNNMKKMLFMKYMK